MARGRGYGLFLSPGKFILVLQTSADAARGEPPPASVVQLAFAGANLDGQFERVDMLPGRTHFLHGQDPKNWRTDLPTFGSVRYANIYPGIDLVLYGHEEALEYDLVVAPGQDPSIIRLAISGSVAPELDPVTGDLVLRLDEDALRLKRPYIYQERNGARTTILGRYVFPDGAPRGKSASRSVPTTGHYRWSSIRCSFTPPTLGADKTRCPSGLRAIR